MISLEKWMILAPLLKLPKNVEDLGKLIVAKGSKKLPKVQKSPTLVTLNNANASCNCEQHNTKREGGLGTLKSIASFISLVFAEICHLAKLDELEHPLGIAMTV